MFPNGFLFNCNITFWQPFFLVQRKRQKLLYGMMKLCCSFCTVTIHVFLHFVWPASCFICTVYSAEVNNNLVRVCFAVCVYLCYLLNHFSCFSISNNNIFFQ
mmetsp:Transcript_100129/g.229837  ORF Transcript_100129/g.229837 Transcript_100129/m.229837 type:complete len:102 (-) Transcript_100129:26-331(-)